MRRKLLGFQVDEGRDRSRRQIGVNLSQMNKQGYACQIDLSEVRAQTLRRGQALQPIANLQTRCSLISHGIEHGIVLTVPEHGTVITACGAGTAVSVADISIQNRMT